MERRERNEKESKIRGRRGLFLFLLALVFHLPSCLPFLSIPLCYFRSFVTSRSHCALPTFSSMLRKTTDDAWRAFRCNPTHVHVLAVDWKARKENEEKGNSMHRDPLEARCKLQKARLDEDTDAWSICLRSREIEDIKVSFQSHINFV